MSRTNGLRAESDDPADVLLRKMTAAKISRWHPDPLAALEDTK